MYVVLRNREAVPAPVVPTKGSVVALAAAKIPLQDASGGQGNVFGWTDLDAAKDEALKMARAYPGNRYDVFELTLIGSAETPIATWSSAGGTT